MADQVEYQGRLIAVDGSRGKDVRNAAREVRDALRAAGIKCAVSSWDASGLFGEFAAGGGDRGVSPRVLSLVYAADLAFRLRWEIRPALEAGGIIVAAPYVDTAIAFGASCGLEEKWLRELLRFAPQPDWRVRSEERKVEKSWKRRLDRGYPEFAAMLLDQPAPAIVTASTRRRMIDRLEAAGTRRTYHITAKSLGALAKACRADAERRTTGSRPDASSRGPSPPRSGRK